MYNQSPLTIGFFGYSSGGARALVDEISDNPMMQEMKGSFMQGEAREKIESPQNYGFTSVVMPAKKGKDGSIEECAEAYLSFLGGSRSFPVATVMDDRRYRLKELKPGDVAIFDHTKQQFHFNKDGIHMTGLDNKKIRFSLLKADDDQQQGGGGGAATRAGETGGGSSSSGGGDKKKGQKQRYEKAEQESKRFMDLNEKNMSMAHDADISAKAGQTLAMEGTAIKRKSEGHYFDGDVHITGNLYISQQGFKPTGPEWAPGTATPAPSDSDDVFAYVKRPPIALSEAQLATFARMRSLPDQIKIMPDGSVVIDGDLAVVGNLTVHGIIRARGFEPIA